MRCLRCGRTLEPLLTGMGVYGKCRTCFFRWAQEGSETPMSYLVEDGSSAGEWLDVPDGCLFVAEGRSGEGMFLSGNNNGSGFGDRV